MIPVDPSTLDPAPVVVKIGGALLDAPDARAAFLDRLALAAGAGASIVLVHGGGGSVDRHLARIGVATERIDGIRVTPPELMPEIAAILAGQVGTGLLADLRRRRVPSIALRLGDDASIETSRLSGPIDPGSVGTVVGGRATLVAGLLASGLVPVIASIGLLADGTPVNVNADDAAAGIARALEATALLLLTDVPGVLGADGRVIPQLDETIFTRLVDDGTITGGMIPKVRGALAAARHSGSPVVIGHWADPAVLSAPLAADTIATVVRTSPTGMHHAPHHATGDRPAGVPIQEDPRCP